jgi:hypothetical protein
MNSGNDERTAGKSNVRGGQRMSSGDNNAGTTNSRGDNDTAPAGTTMA